VSPLLPEDRSLGHDIFADAILKIFFDHLHPLPCREGRWNFNRFISGIARPKIVEDIIHAFFLQSVEELGDVMFLFLGIPINFYFF